MSNTLRIKRSTSTDAPTTLQNAELAFSESSNKLFYGVGTGGVGGSATSIVAIGGSGAFVDLNSTQTVGGVKTFSSSPVIPTPTTNYQSATKLYVDSAISGVPLNLYAPIASPTFTGTVTIPSGASISGYLTTSSASSTYAPIASPTFTGTPYAPTASSGTNNTQIATTQFVGTAISNLVASAPSTLDTLNELATALGNDPSFATTITTNIGTKMAKSANLSDVASISTARSNLGLGTMAVQDASSVTITGGSINGITLDGGTF